MLRRFIRDINLQGITTIFVVVVMLLLFTISCTKEVKEVVNVEYNPETSYTMKATKVSTLISDSGITRYRLETDTWLVFGNAKEPYWYFPDAVYVEKFDSLFNAEASIKADTAYFYDKKGLWHLIGNVEVKNLQGERFDTSELFWDQKNEKIYSDKYIRLQQEEQIITGEGFESNQNLTRYTISNSKGVFPDEDSQQPKSEVDSILISDTLVSTSKVAPQIKQDIKSDTVSKSVKKMKPMSLKPIKKR